MMIMRIRAFLARATCALFVAGVAHAAVPDEYHPLIVMAPASETERLFDITAAVDLARAEGKPLYLYLGAEDCGPCKVYSKFLRDNEAELLAGFKKVVLVDIRTSIRGADVVFKVGSRRYTLAEFKAVVGDKNRSLTYPYFWMVSADLKMVKEMPWGSGNYMPVRRQLEVLQVP